MDVEKHPLLQLPAEKQRDLANLVDSDEIDAVAQKTGYSRRQVLGILAALGTSAAVGGFTISEMIGVVEAAASTSDSDGNVGLPGDRVDVFSESIDNAGTLSTDSIDIDGTYHYAGDDSELTNVLSNVSEGDTVILGNADYTTDRTFSTRGLTLKGSGAGNRGTRVDASWVSDSRVTFRDIGNIVGSASIELSRQSRLVKCYGDGSTPITVSGDAVLIEGCHLVDVTFQSGTSNGLVDSCILTSVTDNGSNTTGDT